MNETITSKAVSAYLKFWNAAPDDRADLAPEVFTDDVCYHAPIGPRVGVDAVVELGREFDEHLGPLTFRPRRDPDVHHDRARLAWEIVRQGASFAEGTDVLTVDEQGRIGLVITFLDRAPEGFDPHAHDETERP